MVRIVAIVIVSVLTYTAAIGRFEPWDVVLSASVATVTVYGFRAHLLRGESPPARTLPRRILFAPLLVAFVMFDIIRSTILVARYTLRLIPLEHPGIVAIPLGERTRFGATMSGFFTTIAPGTFLVDFDWAERVMLIHAIDASDPDAVRATHQAFYDRFQRHVFP